MTVYDLNRDQLIELKQRYLQDTQGDLSWGELAAADDLISDKFIMEYWADTDFTPDDFFSSADEEDEYVQFYINTNGNRSEIAEALREIADAVDRGVYGGRQNGIEWGCDKLY